MAEAAQMKVSDEIAITISKMNKWYGAFHVLRDIDLVVNRGERIVKWSYTWSKLVSMWDNREFLETMEYKSKCN